MKLELPMVVCHRSSRLVEAWLPRLGLRALGPSLAELRDDLALRVMLAFEKEPAARLRLYQLPPQLRMRQVKLDVQVKDAEKNRRWKLTGRLGVILEKWPADDFWIAMPARLEIARFALRDPDALDAALARHLAEIAAEHGIESLEPYQSPQRERLDVLEVDADAPTILPRRPRPPPRPATTRKKGAKAPAPEPETPAQREERRRRARLQATALREATRNLSHGVEDDTLERCFGREALVEALVDEIVGREGVALVLVGPTGAGKTALVHELTRRLAARHAAAGQRRDVWRIDGGRFIAGMSFVGQWEQRARKMCAELVETGDLLYADDLASLVYAGRTGSSDTNLAQFVFPHLARGEINVIAESTPERMDRVREEAPTFAALFRVVHVPPLDARATLPVLLGVLRDLEADESAGPLPPRVTPAALEVLLDGVGCFRPHEAYPGKAVRLLRRVVASGGGLVQNGARRFEPAQVFASLRAETGLPDFVLGATQPRPRESVRRELAAMVAGQDEAVDAVTDVVMTLQTGLNDPDKPLATMLLVGPTGVGKTETAKALAKYLFGSPDRLLRFDMSELNTGASLARLVGQAGGADGELTTALRSQPFRVILFDEIEKAHPRVFDALLQLLGEGRLSDAAGRTADARQAVILMTSNLGVREAAARPGFVQPGEAARQHYLSAVRAFFRPEFFNRIDRVVPYGPLDKVALRVVVEHALEDLLSRRGIRRGHVLVDVEPELLQMLVEQAFDPRYGARPLRRALERRLTVPLAHHLVTRRGDDLALVELYRRGQDLGLGVRLLADAAPLPAGEDPGTWSLARLAAAVDEAGVALRRLAASPAAKALAEPLAQLQVRVDELALEDLEATVFGEEEDQPIKKALRWAVDRRDVGHGGLRQRQGFRDVPLEHNAEPTLKRVRPMVARVRDELAVLTHRLAAAETRGDEALTLLFECVGVPSIEALETARWMAPTRIARHTRWEEVGEAGGAAWSAHEGVITRKPALRRIAYAFSGPGLRELLAPLAGWVLVEIVQGGLPLTVPVRVDLCEGEGAEAIAARDARVRAERERRRAAAVTEPLEPGVIVARQRERGGALWHLASGRAASDHEGVAAALLRAGAGAGRADGG